jgi:hypothetical protein
MSSLPLADAICSAVTPSSSPQLTSIPLRKINIFTSAKVEEVLFIMVKCLNT